MTTEGRITEEFTRAVGHANNTLSQRFDVDGLKQIDVNQTFGKAPLPGWQASYRFGHTPPTINLYDNQISVQDIAFHEVAHAFHDKYCMPKPYCDKAFIELQKYYNIKCEEEWTDPAQQKTYSAITVQPQDASILMTLGQSYSKAILPIEFFAHVTQYVFREERKRYRKATPVTLTRKIGNTLHDTYALTAAQLEQKASIINSHGKITEGFVHSLCENSISLFEALKRMTNVPYRYAELAAQLSVSGCSDSKPTVALNKNLYEWSNGQRFEISVSLATFASRRMQVQDHWDMLRNSLQKDPDLLAEKAHYAIRANITRYHLESVIADTRAKSTAHPSSGIDQMYALTFNTA